MSRFVFHELLDLLKGDLTRNEDMATGSSVSPVDIEIFVAIFLTHACWSLIFRHDVTL